LTGRSGQGKKKDGDHSQNPQRGHPQTGLPGVRNDKTKLSKTKPRPEKRTQNGSLSRQSALQQNPREGRLTQTGAIYHRHSEKKGRGEISSGTSFTSPNQTQVWEKRERGSQRGCAAENLYHSQNVRGRDRGKALKNADCQMSLLAKKKSVQKSQKKGGNIKIVKAVRPQTVGKKKTGGVLIKPGKRRSRGASRRTKRRERNRDSRLASIEPAL